LYNNSVIEKLKPDTELIEREVKKLNLVILGLADFDTQSIDQLKEQVAKLVLGLTGKQIETDTVHRLGKYQLGNNRPVKVRFLSLTDRDLVWSNRLNSNPPIFVNEDLPFVTRKDFAILRKKSKELKEKGETVSIQWNNKTITSGTAAFQVSNGCLTSVTSRNPSSISTSQQPLFQKAHHSQPLL